MTTNEKVALLRGAMKENNLAGCIIPSRDPHISEYLAKHYQLRRWISGFTGSAGTLAFTDKKSGLWTDGRYYIQAERELEGSEIELYRSGEKDVKTVIEFLSDELSEGDKVGIDGRLFTKNEVKDYKRKLSEKGIELICTAD